MSDRSEHSFYGLHSIAVALVLSALIGAKAVRDVKRAGDTIHVTGSARTRVVSDYIIWRGSLVTRGRDLQTATREILRYQTTVQSFMRGAGIPDSNIVRQPISNYTEMEYSSNGRPTGRIANYVVSQNWEVRSSDIERILAAAGQSDELMQEGVPITFRPAEFLYTRLDSVRVALMADATKDAQARATQIARAADGRLGSIRSARMGVIQVVAPNSTNVSDYGTYDTTTREKDVVAVVKAEFAVR